MRKVALSVAGITILALVVWQLFKMHPFAKPLSVAEARDKIQDLYKGEIIEVTEHKTTYRMTLLLDTGIYEIEIDRDTGEIGRVTRIKKDPKDSNIDPEINESENPASPKTNEQPESEIPAQQISEAEAIGISLANVTGEVDDVDLEQSGGETYYLVKIKTVNGDEGTVQIHAITGEVMSISWDD
jgi:uncharacterized membrane protein YkoI